MDASNILELIEQLDEDVDDMEESLAPLLKTALSESASKLPLLDKAKLYILVTYAIESMLFAYLRINGVKARDHPVFKELTRVKQYFDKIKAIETPAAERTMAVDKGAASRFIKAGLSGNDKYDLERAERQAKEKARAHIKFEQLTQVAKKRKAEEPVEETESFSSSGPESSSGDEEKPADPERKKQKILKTSSSESTPQPTPSHTTTSRSKGKNKKSKRKFLEGDSEALNDKSKKKEKKKKEKPKA